MYHDLGPIDARDQERKLLTRRPATQTAAQRTLSLDVSGVQRLVITVELEHNAATAITLAPSMGRDASINAPQQSASVAAGVMSLVDMTQTHLVSGNKTVQFLYDVRGLKYFSALLSVADASATDYITVYGSGE